MGVPTSTELETTEDLPGCQPGPLVVFGGVQHLAHGQPNLEPPVVTHAISLESFGGIGQHEIQVFPDSWQFAGSLAVWVLAVWARGFGGLAPIWWFSIPICLFGA